MIKLNDEEFGTLVICALRYCHGRQTYMPKRVQDIVKVYLPELSDKDLRVIEEDLNDMRDYDFGDPVIDRPNWQRFQYAVEEERKRRHGSAD